MVIGKWSEKAGVWQVKEVRREEKCWGKENENEGCVRWLRGRKVLVGKRKTWKVNWR